MKITLTELYKLDIKENNLKDENKAGHALFKVICCAVCRTDAKMWAQGHRDLVLPRVLGHEMVVADDKGRYVVWPGNVCGTCDFCTTGRENLCEEMKITGFHLDGGFADHVLLAPENLIPIPPVLDSTIACFAEPVGCVIHAFEKLQLSADARVLIYGGGTMGLIAALYAKSIGVSPLIIENDHEKIKKSEFFLEKTGIDCVKETRESGFDAVINACPDYIAFCQGITKTGKGGQISFFSGLTKNQHIETNLINLMHYKEIMLSGAYGLTRKNLKQAVAFLEAHQTALEMLIEDIVMPQDLTEIMEKVLSGRHFKYIVDMSGSLLNSDVKTKKISSTVQTSFRKTPSMMADLDKNNLCRRIIEQIRPVDDTLLAAAVKKIDGKTKPLGALGRLEDLAVQVCLIQNRLDPAIQRKMLFVFAGDHGITEEGVSAYPSEVTGQMVLNFLHGGAAINVLCRHQNIEIKIVDMGVAGEFDDHPDLIKKKVKKGTNNFAVGPAMTADELITALENGMTVFLDQYEKEKIDIVGLGEMGIGNTTSASAIISAVTGISPSKATGRGTGVDDKGLAHKTAVIQKALDFHTPDPKDGFDILCKIGGFEIAGMAGAMLAAASKNATIVLDGVISTAAGLVASLIHPDIKGYLVSGHKSVEQAQQAALSFMGLEPLIDFRMRLGEGTGAAMTIDVVEAACKIMTQMASFEEAKVSTASAGDTEHKG